jgi:hypothetical protein
MRATASSWLCVALALIGFAGAPARAQESGERLVSAPLPELVIGHQVDRGGSLIIERIPPGETVQSWTRMVTLQRFAGSMANGLTLQAWAGTFSTNLRNSCPGFSIDGPHYSGARPPEVQFRVDCPRNPATGRPETFLLRAFGGQRDLHVLQVAFRHVPTAREVAWARNHLASAIYCAPGSPVPACTAGDEGK